MLFTSYEFIGFLALLFLLYYLIPKRGQWMLLLGASYAFYALASPSYLIFILFTTLTAFFCGIFMGRISTSEKAYLAGEGASFGKEERKAYRAKRKKQRLWILLGGVILNFGVLAVLKYTGFAVVNFNELLHLFGVERSLDIPDLILPMGISFYTFQSMGYLMDVYRAKAEPERNIARFALFVSFFPQLIQGPISRFGDLVPQFFAPHKAERRHITYGLQRILWGYFKKLVIADRIMVAVNLLMEDTNTYTGSYVFLLLIFYSIRIYADFTGGIDITIGIAETLGIRLAENFKRPFSSHSTKEYWNRWHITMGSWFTDYVFYPLSVSRPMLKISKWSRKHLGNALGKRIPVYVATIVTWYLTGLWHGAGWNFIVWGLLNCLVILVSQEFEPLYKKFRERVPKLYASRPYGTFMALRTFLLMGLIRTLDCYRDVGLTFSLWGSMLTDWNWGQMLGGGWLALGLTVSDYVILAAGCILMALVSKAGERQDVRERLYDRPVLSWCAVGVLLLAVISLGAYGIGYDATQFIYNQF